MKLSSGSPWLSAKNDPECDGQTITFKNEGEWRQSTKFTYDDGNPVNQLIFTIDYKDEERQMSLIKPSKEAMIEAFGDDTIAWVGQKAVIALALNTKGGKSIMLTPIRSAVQAPVQGELPAIDVGEEEIPF